MRRRDLVTLIGAAALARAPTAVAQQASLPVIGFLHSGSPGPFANVVAAFRDGLRDAGYAPGQNVRIDFRWAEGNYDLLPSLALDLARREVSVIVAGGRLPGARREECDPHDSHRLHQRRRSARQRACRWHRPARR